MIDLDYYDNELDFGEERKIKPFSWQRAFPEVFNRKIEATEKEDLSSLAQKAKHHAKKAMEYATELEEKISQVSEDIEQYEAKGGFDCIIGNPPYVNVENLSPETKSYLFEKYKTCKGRTDIYVAFIEKSNSLVKENGMVSFIIPYAFTNQKYGEEARKMLINNYFINEIIDISNYYVFEQAVVKNIILSYLNRKAKSGTEIKIVKSKAIL